MPPSGEFLSLVKVLTQHCPQCCRVEPQRSSPGTFLFRLDPRQGKVEKAETGIQQALEEAEAAVHEARRKAFQIAMDSVRENITTSSSSRPPDPEVPSVARLRSSHRSESVENPQTGIQAAEDHEKHRLVALLNRSRQDPDASSNRSGQVYTPRRQNVHPSASPGSCQ